MSIVMKLVYLLGTAIFGTLLKPVSTSRHGLFVGWLLNVPATG